MRKLAILALALAACSADRPDVMPGTGSGSGNGSGSGEAELDAPSIDMSTPTATPEGTVAVRGSTSGARVVIKGGPGDPVVEPVLPSGGFCIDAPLLANGPTTLFVYALKDGIISPPAMLTVTQDTSAAIPQSPMCQGMEQATCTPEAPSSSDCSDGKDNDCNGLVDQCDPGCNMCQDDALGPNSTPFFVPEIAIGGYDLQICPCAPDWFSFTVNAGDIIHTKISFDTTVVDLDMMLQTPKQAESNDTANLAISEGTTNTEEITYTATAAGTYYIKVYPYSANGFGPYHLTIY